MSRTTHIETDRRPKDLPLFPKSRDINTLHLSHHPLPNSHKSTDQSNPTLNPTVIQTDSFPPLPFPAPVNSPNFQHLFPQHVPEPEPFRNLQA